MKDSFQLLAFELKKKEDLFLMVSIGSVEPVLKREEFLIADLRPQPPLKSYAPSK